MSFISRRSILEFILIFFLLGLIGEPKGNLFAHEGKIHEAKEEKIDTDDDGFEIISRGPTSEQVEAVNMLYLKNVKPIFESKCFDCHGKGRALPWYSSIPGAKQLIAKDIREAKEHMDMSNDIPFVGHGTLKDDLSAIERILSSGTMPPFRYRMMHWSSKLEKDEKKTIRLWIEASRMALESLKKSKTKEK